MKNLILAVTLALSFAVTASAAKKQQPEPPPERGSGTSDPACPSYDCNDERDRGPDGKHQENYEGGGRGGNDSPDDGWESGDTGSGGMMGELFYTQPKKTHPTDAHVKKEDRGDTIVYTTTTQEDISASETCTTVVTTVIEKKTGKVLSTATREYCNSWPL